jgi:hypothetical protein
MASDLDSPRERATLTSIYRGNALVHLTAVRRDIRMLGGIFLIGSSLFLLMLCLLARFAGPAVGLLAVFGELLPFALGGLAFGIYLCWQDSRRP